MARCWLAPENCDHTVADIQRLWKITAYSKLQFAPHSGIFVPISANLAALWGPLGPLPLRRLHGLYQMLSKQGNHFSLCGTWTPQTPMPASGDSPYFLTRAPPGTELQNCRLCAPLFIESWWYRNPLLSSGRWFWETDFLFSSL